MRIVFEPGDFTFESGKTPEVLSDEIYGWWLKIVKRADRPAFAGFYHRGASYRIEPAQLTVEIEGAKPQPATKPKPPSSPRGEGGKFIKKDAEPEPALTGPALPDMGDWYEG